MLDRHRHQHRQRRSRCRQRRQQICDLYDQYPDVFTEQERVQLLRWLQANGDNDKALWDKHQQTLRRITDTLGSPNQ